MKEEKGKMKETETKSNKKRKSKKEGREIKNGGGKKEQ